MTNYEQFTRDKQTVVIILGAWVEQRLQVI